ARPRPRGVRPRHRRARARRAPGRRLQPGRAHRPGRDQRSVPLPPRRARGESVMTKPRNPSRRSFLRSAGVTLALPFLGSLRPRRAMAQAVAPPSRLLVIYTPNGMNMADWTPATTGKDYVLTPILKPLSTIKED